MHIQEITGLTMQPENRGSLAFSQNVVASSGITFHIWRLYHHAWLVCLLFPLLTLMRKQVPTWQLVAGIFILLFFAVSYTWLMWPHPASQEAHVKTQSWLSFFLFVTLTILVTITNLVYGPAWLWLFIGVSAIAGLLLPLWIAFTMIVLFTLFPLLINVGMHGGTAGIDWWWLIALMLLVRGLGLDMIGIARMGHAIQELHIARRELARLKVEEERLRLARDLHDLLGQSLSIITLKSELATSLLHDDPIRCAQELVEIEHISRKTLREVRKTVAGYRQPTLANELDGACQLLAAAGISYSIEVCNVELPQPLDAALAWVVREGVTNVVRHSRAHHCLLRFTCEHGRIGVEVLNDGKQVEETAELCSGRGCGLLGLQERVCALGGFMEAGPLTCLDKPHFRLCVELPIRPQMSVPIVQGKPS